MTAMFMLLSTWKTVWNDRASSFHECGETIMIDKETIRMFKGFIKKRTRLYVLYETAPDTLYLESYSREVSQIIYYS
jgi:hypothetical protein